MINLLEKEKGLLARLVAKELGESNLDTCFGCASCSNVCLASGRESMDPCMLIQLILQGQDDVAINTKWIWYCCHCGKCNDVCPMDVDVSAIIHLIKSIQGVADDFHAYQEKMASWFSTGNNVRIYPNQFLELVREAETIYEKRTGRKGFNFSIDEQGARLLLLIDPEVMVENPGILADYAHILELCHESWTLSSTALGTVDMAINSGKPDNGLLWLKKLEGIVTGLDVSLVLMDDCQNSLSLYGPGSLFATKSQSNSLKVTTLPMLLNDYLAKGRTVLHKAFESVCVQWPCAHDDGFKVVTQKILSETSNVVEELMEPSCNFTCCGGGLARSGLIHPHPEEDGKVWNALQFHRCGSKRLVTLCASCFLQLKKLARLSFADVEVLFFPELVCASIGFSKKD